MRYLILATTLILLSGCIHLYKTKKSHSNNNIISLYNKGTICTRFIDSKQIYIKYYPLSTNCISSSKIDWKLLGIDTKVKNNSLNLNTYALYRQNISNLATTDCSGAGVKEKIVKTQYTIKTIYWDKTKLIDSQNKKLMCFKKSNNSIKKVISLK